MGVVISYEKRDTCGKYGWTTMMMSLCTICSMHGRAPVEVDPAISGRALTRDCELGAWNMGSDMHELGCLDRPVRNGTVGIENQHSYRGKRRRK